MSLNRVYANWTLYILLTSYGVSYLSAIASEPTLASPSNDSLLDTPLTAILRWNSPSPDTQYEIVLSTDSKLEQIIARTQNITGEWRIAICPQTTYWWQVYEIRGDKRIPAKNGPWSFRTPSPVIRQDAPPLEKYGAFRSHSRCTPPESLAEDPDMPLSPWFYKKHYDMPPCPAFEQVKNLLPAPVLDGPENKNLLDTYWYAWKIAYDFYLYEPIEKGQAVTYMNACPYWAGWGSMQYFDTSFIIQYARYALAPFSYVTVLDNVYCRQHENGFIMKETDSSNYEVWSGDPTLPPLFAWAEWESYQISADRKRLENILLPLVKYYEWLQRYHRRPNGHYFTNQPGHGDWCVFMDATVAQMAWSIGQIANEVGRSDLAKYFQSERELLADIINREFWDDKYGIYASRDPQGKLATEPEPGKFYKSTYNFCPLMADLSPQDRAERAIKHMLNPEEFMGKYGVPNLSFDSSFYVADWAKGYQSPEKQPYRFKETVWPPFTVMAIKSLQNYGYHDEASDLAERYARALAEIYHQHGDVTEFSWTNELAPGGNQKFVGWSGFGPIACLIESVLGFNLNAPQNTLTWRIHRKERHGIQQLRFGNVTANLICEERASLDQPCNISVTSDHPFNLVINWGEKKLVQHVKPGTITFTLSQNDM